MSLAPSLGSLQCVYLYAAFLLCHPEGAMAMLIQSQSHRVRNKMRRETRVTQKSQQAGVVTLESSRPLGERMQECSLGKAWWISTHIIGLQKTHRREANRVISDSASVTVQGQRKTGEKLFKVLIYFFGGSKGS